MEADRSPDGPADDAARFTQLKQRLGSWLLGLTAWIIILALILPPLSTGWVYLFGQ